MFFLWLGRLFLLVGYPSLVAMPFAPESLKLAKGAAAGEVSDELLRSFKLHDRVLKKLPYDFDAEKWFTAQKKYYYSLQARSKAAIREQPMTEWRCPCIILG